MPLLAERDRTVFLIIDFQEKFLPVIYGVEKIQSSLILIAKAAGVLRVPLLVSEQYPKGLGTTVDDLKSHINDAPIIEKSSFGCFGEPKFAGRLTGLQAKTLVVGGVESHVCVCQTVLQALDEGYAVHVLADAIGSRDPRNTEIALTRMQRAGATLSSTEMILFELLRKAGTAEFKEVQKLIVNRD